MSEILAYVHLVPGAAPPERMPLPLRAVVIVESQATAGWQALVSDWLVESGCLYMMAWGIDCSTWDDSVDKANSERFDYGEIPEDQFVMTTWHSDESISEVFWFAKNVAHHPTIALAQTALIHIAAEAAGDRILQAYDEA